jgi:glycosyltransferase involved in cell wall biosynthesis
MRIAQAIALYPPEFRGGATLVCERLTEELAARGHVLDVFSGRTTAAEPLGAVRREPVGSALTWRVNLGGAFLPWSREGWQSPVAAESFAEFLRAARPDVVHAHSLQALGVGVLAAAASSGTPVVWTMHDWWWLCPCLFRLAPAGGICPPIPDPERCSGSGTVDFAARRAALAAALRYVARVLVPSRYLRDSLVANGLPAGRITVQENAVAPPAADPAYAGRSAMTGRLQAVFIGGAGNREKGIDVLLRAAERIGCDDVEIHLHSVEADVLDTLPARARARLHTHPSFRPGEIDRVLASADVVVVPSRMRESCSLVTREALVRGIPVVTSDCGGPEEVVRPGENGLVVSTGSAAELADALESLAADRALLARLARAPRPVLPTPTEQARAAEAVYREVLREAVRGAASGAGREPGSPPGGRRAVARSSHGGAREDGRGDAVRDGRLAGRRILFLVGIDGAPLRYRVWHLVEQLADLGASAAVLYHSDLAARTEAAQADLVVLYRAPFSATVAAVVKEARRRGVPVLFSADDLVFDESVCDAPALRDERPEVARGFRWTLDAYGRSFAAADAFLGSTEELVATARASGKASYLHRNGLGRTLLGALDGARQRWIAARDRDPFAHGGARVRAGFLSGTDTHDGDLESIAHALRRSLERLPGLTIVLGGPVRLPADLAPFADRIERWPFVPWSVLAERIATLDVSLAPLALPSRFNEAKSEVKYLEASAAGVATIASPTGPFRSATGEGGTARLAAAPADWEEAIAGLVGDRGGRQALARLARRDVAFRYGPKVQAEALAETVEEVLARGPANHAALPEPIAVDAGEGSSVALEPAANAYDAHQLDAEAACEIVAGSAVEQPFVCRRDGLWRVDVLVGTGWRPRRHHVQLSVIDEEGAVLGRRVLAASTLVDRTFAAVELDRALEHSAGRMLRVRVEAPDTATGEETSVWHAPSITGGLRAGDALVEGRSMVFRSFGEVVA